MQTNYRNHPTQQNYPVLIFLVLLVVFASYSIYHHRIMSPTDNDYSYHILIAERILRNEPLKAYDLSHPFLQFAQIGLIWLSRSRINLWYGTILLMVASNVVLALEIYFWFGKRKKSGSDWLRAFLAISLTFVAPLFLYAPVDGKYYFGYIGLANYHNPTIQLLRPFALPIFILVLQIFSRRENPLWKIIIAAALMIISTLIKPNLSISILPAVFFFIFITILQKKEFDWKMSLFGFILPTIITLMGQYYLYNSGNVKFNQHFIFAPFAVESHFSEFLFAKFLLSIFFPLITLLVYNKSIMGKLEMRLSWFIFFIGALQVYFLAESGSTMYAGNFRWSAQITLLILFITSARFVYQRLEKTNRHTLKELLVVSIAYLPHFFSGIIYFLYCLLTTKYG